MPDKTPPPSPFSPADHPSDESRDAPWQPRPESGWQREADAGDIGAPVPSLDDSWQALDETSRQPDDLVSILQGDYGLRETQAEPVSSEAPASALKPTFPMNNHAVADMEDTHPVERASRPADGRIPVSDVTFYLVPNADSHFLIGELAQRLRGWLPGLCEAYGWQLDLLAVRPDYLKWTLKDFPETLIREALQIVRQTMTARIFRVFPNVRESVQAADYWAPGYLVDTQRREFSTQALRLHFSRKA